MQTPMIAEKAWPKMKFRGCASGESMVWKRRIADAPKDAMIKGLGWFLRVLAVRKTPSMMATPQKAPIKDHRYIRDEGSLEREVRRWPRKWDKGLGRFERIVGGGM